MTQQCKDLTLVVLDKLNERSLRVDDGEYFHRVSAVSRCIRDAVMHALEVPWSNPTQPQWGQQITFDQGHDAEYRVIDYITKAGIEVSCSQMRVEATTPMGMKMAGHIDGMMIVPDDMPMGGKWYLFDVKSTSVYGYNQTYEENKAKPNHIKQLSIYKHAVVADDNYPEVAGIKVKDLEFNGVKYGGMIVCYFPKERPTKGYGDKKIELPKLHFITFDTDETENDVFLDFFDAIEDYKNRGVLPPVPDASDEMVWGGYNKKAGAYKARRCDPRWCARYDACRENN